MSALTERIPRDRLRRYLLAAGVAGYLALVLGVMLWRGIEIEPQWVFLALLLVAITLGRGREYVRDWLPFLVLFFAYEVMRGFAAKGGLPPLDVGVLETSVFGATLPTVWLQHHFYDPSVIRPYDWVAMGLYFMHFPLPLLVGFMLWVQNRRRYWTFVAALLLTSFTAFVTYLFLPTAPPWWQQPDQIHKVINETVQKWGVSYMVSPLYTKLNPNKFAAFPSMHAAYPALAVIHTWAQNRWVSSLLVGWTAAVWLAIVYSGEHYVVDALAGLVYALVASALVWLLVRRLRTARPA